MLSVHAAKVQKHQGAKNYLGTASIKVVGRNPEEDTSARALFDPGAQVALVTQEVVETLQCETVPSEVPYLIHGVEQNKPVYADRYALLHLKKKRKKFTSKIRTVTIKALIIQQPPWGLTVPYPPAHWIKLLEPQLADPELLETPARKTFDIILSTDLCVKFLKDIVYKHGGFQIRKSVFGLVLEGEAPDPSDELPQNGRHPFHEELGLPPPQLPNTSYKDVANIHSQTTQDSEFRGGISPSESRGGKESSQFRGALILKIKLWLTWTLRSPKVKK